MNSDLKEIVIIHLGNISNQNAIVHYGEKSVTITELIEEVKNETEMGLKYISGYKEAVDFLNK